MTDEAPPAPPAYAAAAPPYPAYASHPLLPGASTSTTPTTPSRGADARWKAALKAVGALLALTVALFTFAGAMGYFAGQLPHKEDLGTVIAVLTLGGFWLGGAVWLGKRASWGWAGGFLLCWPITLPLYVYKAARGERSARPSFPTLVTFGAIAAITALLFIGGAAFSSNPVAPQAAEAEGGQEVAAVTLEESATAQPEATEAKAKSTAKPTKTPRATSTRRPTKTATAEPTKTPKPTKTATAKPTKTPKPKATKTPRPRATSTPRPPVASFDPEGITRSLLVEPVYDNEKPSLGYPGVSLSDDPMDGAFADIEMECDYGVLTFLVFDSDRDAERFVVNNQSGREWGLAEYPGLTTAVVHMSSGTVFVMALYGNVVVLGGTSYEMLVSSGYDSIGSEPDVMAAVMVTYGVTRVQRLAGTVSDGSSGNTL